ncbi:MAG: hypothetical protein U1C56_02640 [Candidatus Curtissbacteria bacterium]|nr:hypothetical protein [Candidatus Curtissbacteria bacterium]
MKKYAGKTHWVTKLGKDVSVELLDCGAGGANHNLLCWICNENKAVYNMYPNWIFQPCWDCQARLDLTGIEIEYKKKKWWEFWKKGEELNNSQIKTFLSLNKNLLSDKIISWTGKVMRQKCDRGHKLKVIGHSCCDDIVECKCGKWFRCGTGGFWKYE